MPTGASPPRHQCLYSTVVVLYACKHHYFSWWHSPGRSIMWYAVFQPNEQAVNVRAFVHCRVRVQYEPVFARTYATVLHLCLWLRLTAVYECAHTAFYVTHAWQCTCARVQCSCTVLRWRWRNSIGSWSMYYREFPMENGILFFNSDSIWMSIECPSNVNFWWKELEYLNVQFLKAIQKWSNFALNKTCRCGTTIPCQIAGIRFLTIQRWRERLRVSLTPQFRSDVSSRCWSIAYFAHARCTLPFSGETRIIGQIWV